MHKLRVLVLLAGAGCVVTPCTASTDFHLDGVEDHEDNCVLVANPYQTDSDADGLGNRCDFDLNNDCRVNVSDLGLIRRALSGAVGPNRMHADFNGDRRVDIADFVAAARATGQPLGVSGGANLCTCRPPEVRTDTPNDEFGGLSVFLQGAFSETVVDGNQPRVFSDQGRGRYLSRVYVRKAGRYEYRIADPSLSLEYCTSEAVELVSARTLATGACTGTPGTVELPAPGCYEFAVRTHETERLSAQLTLRVVERLGSRDVVIRPSGGRYRLPGGAELTVPSGAVSERTTVTISELPCAAIDAMVEETALRSHDHRCLGGIVGEPDGFSFDEPVTISLPVRGLKGGEIPLWITRAGGEQDYLLIPGVVELDGRRGTLTTSFSHFSSVAASAATAAAPEVSSTGTLPPCCSDRSLAGPEGCCCDTLRIQVAEGDVSASDCDCQLVGQDIEIEFLACPGKPLQRVSEFHSTDECPTDFVPKVEPKDLTMWTCEDRTLAFSLEGTNEDGSECRLSMPTKAAVSSGRHAVELVDTGSNTYRLTGRSEGHAEIDFSSLVLKDTALRVSADVVSLDGRWRVVEEGSQTCRIGADAYGESDSGSGPLQIKVKNCKRTIISTPNIDGDTAVAGRLTKTGNPSKPFTYKLKPNDPDRTVDCLQFMQSNGRAIGFGAPFCPDGGCQALSCTEKFDALGQVGPAARGRAGAETDWDFRATWRQRRGDEVVTLTGRCRGGSESVLTQQR